MGNSELIPGQLLRGTEFCHGEIVLGGPGENPGGRRLQS